MILFLLFIVLNRGEDKGSLQSFGDTDIGVPNAFKRNPKKAMSNKYEGNKGHSEEIVSS